MGSRKRAGKKKRLFRKQKPGTAPGTVTTDPNANPSEISIVAYGPDDMIEKKLDGVNEASEYISAWPVTWINVDGLKDAAVIHELGSMLGLHDLALEDVVYVHQRTKVESYESYLFIVSRMLRTVERLETEQFSMFLGPNYVLTFQEAPGDCFDPVRDRIREGRKMFRNSGPDYLAYALIDALIDSYFPCLENCDEQLDQLECDVLDQPDHTVVEGIHAVRKDMLTLRRAVWPMREAINTLVRSEDHLIKSETRIYLRDCYDHTIQVVEILENLREISSGLVDLYHSNIGNRMNEIMKVLTLIATLFIPLSFVTGLYGMNFDTQKSPWNMPELGWRFGYPCSLLLMLGIAVLQLYYFKRKGWIGSQPGKRKESEKKS